MLNVVYEWLCKIKSKNTLLYNISYKVCKILINIVCHISFRLFKKHIGVDINSNIIVSLTSFPERIDKVWITIETLLNQSKKPKKIILWLANTQFKGLDEIPRSLIKQINRGLEIRFCEDLRSHKKYYYTMKEFPNNIIITVDDDIIYPNNLVNDLYNVHKKFPNCICCNWSHQIVFDKNSCVSKYDNWHDGDGILTIPRFDTVPVGYAGVLYPPNSLNNEVFNISKIKKLSPIADDIWLKAMSLKNGVKVIRTKQIQVPFFNIIGTQKFGLFKVNCLENENDKQIRNIQKEYPNIFKMDEILGE